MAHSSVTPPDLFHKLAPIVAPAVVVAGMSGCLGDLDDPIEVGGTDTEGCFTENCNGVRMHCYNDEVVDESGGYNYWWDNTSQANCPTQNFNEFGYCQRPYLYPLGPVLLPPQSWPGEIQAIPYCVGEDVFDDNNVDWEQDWGTGEYPQAIEDIVRAACSQRCVEENIYPNINTPVCDDAKWSHALTVPDWEPSVEGLNCNTASNLNADDPDGSEIDWSLVGGSPSSMPLSCDLTDDCADAFYPSVGAYIRTPGLAQPIEPETRMAHYLGVEGTGSQLEVDMPGGGSGVDDTESLFGQAEYSAVDCGDDVCPFYLANLSAFNTTDSWDIRLDTTTSNNVKKSISSLQIDLLQSTLGVQNMSLGKVAFAPGALRLLVDFTVSSCGTCDSTGDGRHVVVVENDDYVFADYSSGDLDVDFEFAMQDGDATLSVGVVADEEPPVASHDLSSSEECDTLTGLELDEDRAFSTDPDNDIEAEFWWVDGEPCGHGCILPFGSTYRVAIEARDARGAAHRTANQLVEVTVGTACSVLAEHDPDGLASTPTGGGGIDEPAADADAVPDATDDSGCACTSGGADAPVWLGIPVLGLLWARRRNG